MRTHGPRDGKKWNGGDRQYAGHRGAQKGTTGTWRSLTTRVQACLLRQP